MDIEVGNGLIQVVTNPGAAWSGTGEKPTTPPLPGRVLDTPPEEGDEDEWGDETR